MKRVFAHTIVFRGRIYRGHVAQLEPDGSVVFFPFEHEICSTVFVSGAVELEVMDDGSGLSYRVLPDGV